MSLERVHPELIPVLDAFPSDLINLGDITGTRAAFDQMAAAAGSAAAAAEGVDMHDHCISSPGADHPRNIRLYRPTVRVANPLPVLLWMHGGGYVLGNLDQDDITLRDQVKRLACAIVSVDYRLAPEHPHPAPLEDCYRALRWVYDSAGKLGLDRSRIAVGGASAGGGLAAGLALLARDRAEIKIAFQLLIYPMVDDRNTLPASSIHPDTFIWSRNSNRLAWRAYLGAEPGSPEISPYAAPARAPDLSRLPPAYIPVGELDLFLSENIDYARRLIAAGVPAELHVYPGAFHGFDGFAPDASISQRFRADRDAALLRAFSARG